MQSCLRRHERDIFIDVLRVLAVLIVVVGHWATTTVIWEEGRISVENALSLIPESHVATWLLQVMRDHVFLICVCHCLKTDGRLGGRCELHCPLPLAERFWQYPVMLWYCAVMGLQYFVLLLTIKLDTSNTMCRHV